MGQTLKCFNPTADIVDSDLQLSDLQKSGTPADHCHQHSLPTQVSATLPRKNSDISQSKLKSNQSFSVFSSYYHLSSLSQVLCIKFEIQYYIYFKR